MRKCLIFDYSKTIGTDADCRQFGNMLVLAAVHQSRRLSHLISWSQLDSLFMRTREILQAHAAISPTLRTDAEILSHLQSNLSAIHPKTESFSSHAS